jgi:hypothetical protein
MLVSTSCKDVFQDEGFYAFEGYVYEELRNIPIDSVICELYVDDELMTYQYSDSIGYLFIDWSGLLTDNTICKITCRKSGYSQFVLLLEEGEINKDTIFLISND